MSEAIKPTPGPWFVGSSGAFKVASVTNATAIYSDHPPSEKAIWSDAKLIAEAGTVHHETGLTPRQLVEQRDALAKVVADVVAYFDAPGDGSFSDTQLEKARAALALVEGATP